MTASCIGDLKTYVTQNELWPNRGLTSFGMKKKLLYIYFFCLYYCNTRQLCFDDLAKFWHLNFGAYVFGFFSRVEFLNLFQ